MGFFDLFRSKSSFEAQPAPVQAQPQRTECLKGPEAMGREEKVERLLRIFADFPLEPETRQVKSRDFCSEYRVTWEDIVWYRNHVLDGEHRFTGRTSNDPAAFYALFGMQPPSEIQSAAQSQAASLKAPVRVVLPVPGPQRTMVETPLAPSQKVLSATAAPQESRKTFDVRSIAVEVIRAYAQMNPHDTPIRNSEQFAALMIAFARWFQSQGGDPQLVLSIVRQLINPIASTNLGLSADQLRQVAGMEKFAPHLFALVSNRDHSIKGLFVE